MAEVSVLSHGAPAFPDPAFEPDDSFLFEDKVSQDATQVSLPKLPHAQTPKHSNSLDSQNQFKGSLNNHTARLDRKRASPFVLDSSAVPISPQSPEWPYGNSSDLDVISDHREVDSGVVPCFDRASTSFGQITPPTESDEKFPHSAAPASVSLDSGMHDSNASVDSKSERARHAANHRHSNAKRQKSEDLDVDGAAISADSDNAEHKREKYREKNRLAAAKCRAKKKLNANGLEGSARDTERENTRLKLEERKLRDELTQLKEITLAHHPGRCDCDNIHHYNTGQAIRTAQGAQAGVLRGQQSSAQHSGGLSPDLADHDHGEGTSRLFRSIAPSQSQFHTFTTQPQPTAEHFGLSQKDFSQYASDVGVNGSQPDSNFMAGLLHDGHEADMPMTDDSGEFVNFLDGMEGEHFDFDC